MRRASACKSQSSVTTSRIIALHESLWCAARYFGALPVQRRSPERTLKIPPRERLLRRPAHLLTQLRMFSRAGFLPEHESLGDFVRTRGIFPEVLERFREYRAEGHGILAACRAMTV